MNSFPNPPSWDELFMRHVYLVASKSKENRTRVGAILVKGKSVCAEGYNGIVPGVGDDIDILPERYIRPEKYFWQEHAERNALYDCSVRGQVSVGTTMYTSGWPCSDCTRGVIRCGISELVLHKQWMDYEEEFTRDKWEEQSRRSRIMLAEACVRVRILDNFLNLDAYLDGRVIKV